MCQNLRMKISYTQVMKCRKRINQLLTSVVLAFVAHAVSGEDPLYSVDLTVARQGYDGEKFWGHARAGTIPPGTTANRGSDPLVVMTMQRALNSGSDLFYALNEMRTTDLGANWSEPMEHSSFARVPISYKGMNDLQVTVSDFTPRWHAKSGNLLGTGHTVVYENNTVMHVRPRATSYAVYNPEANAWSKWKMLEMPDYPRFENSGAGSVQRYDLANGDILLPVYFKEPEETIYSVAVMRCTFDGETLRYQEHGDELSVPIKRGLYEPSLTRFDGRFFLTMRNDDHGYVAVSDDGLHYDEPKRWTFDDGSDLGNYNTQQHWVVHSEVLFLVYTRRGANNDHVMRHRAPLFIARIDPDKLQVIRATEQILVPEKGARLGNFDITEISESETWVTVAEWMQAPGPNYSDATPLIERGADNRIWVAKLQWTTPNNAVGE